MDCQARSYKSGLKEGRGTSFIDAAGPEDGIFCVMDGAADDDDDGRIWYGGTEFQLLLSFLVVISQ